MQPYTFRVKYLPGPKNIADPLSRLLRPQSALSECHGEDDYVKFVAKKATPAAAMTTREIERESEYDVELQAVRECILSGNWSSLQYKEYLLVQSELCAIGQLILRGTRILIPTNLRKRVLQLAHEGHPGIVSMKQRLRSKVWWPGIDKQAERVCQECFGCQLVSVLTKPEPMIRTELPNSPWEHLACDLLGPSPSGDYLCVGIDYYSRFFELEFTKSITAEKKVSLLSKILVTHGLSIRTDNGPQFINECFKNFMEENGVEHRMTTPLWPQANREIERQNRSILKRLRIAQAEGKNLKSEVDRFLMMYRSTPHSITGVASAELLYGRTYCTKLPQ